MHQRSPAANRRRDMQGLGHLIQVRPLFEARLRVGVDTVGTLPRMPHRQRDQRLLPFTERAFGEYRLVPLRKSLPQLRSILPHVGKMSEVFLMIISSHEF